MDVATKFEMETPSLPASRPNNRRQLSVIIACTAIVCICITIHHVRLEAVAKEEARSRCEPGPQGPSWCIGKEDKNSSVATIRYVDYVL